MKGVSLYASLDLDTEGPDGILIKPLPAHRQPINRNLAERKKEIQGSPRGRELKPAELKTGTLTGKGPAFSLVLSCEMALDGYFGVSKF